MDNAHIEKQITQFLKERMWRILEMGMYQYDDYATDFKEEDLINLNHFDDIYPNLAGIIYSAIVCVTQNRKPENDTMFIITKQDVWIDQFAKQHNINTPVTTITDLENYSKEILKKPSEENAEKKKPTLIQEAIEQDLTNQKHIKLEQYEQDLREFIKKFPEQKDSIDCYIEFNPHSEINQGITKLNQSSVSVIFMKKKLAEILEKICDWTDDITTTKTNEKALASQELEAKNSKPNMATVSTKKPPQSFNLTQTK